MPKLNTSEHCPICGDPSSQDHAPFCGRGCKDRDLLKWLGQGYSIPGTTADPAAPGAPHDGMDSMQAPD